MENENTTVASSSKKIKLVPVIILVLVVLAIVGYAVGGKNKISSMLGKNVPSVATVNGVVIPKSDFDTQLANAITSYKAQGVDLNADATKLSGVKTQILDSLISNELLTQAVKTAGIKSDATQVEAQYQTILTQVGGADKLKAELLKNNLTDEQLHQNIAKQLMIQAYLAQNIDVKSITATDAEIAQFYADYSKSQIAAGQKTVPALKDLSAQIKQQILTTKQQKMITDYIATLRAKASVVISPTL